MFCKTLFIVRANVPPCWLAKIACCAPSTSAALPDLQWARSALPRRRCCGIFPVYGLCIVVALPALTGAALASTGACWMFGRIAACVPCICGAHRRFRRARAALGDSAHAEILERAPQSNTPGAFFSRPCLVRIVRPFFNNRLCQILQDFLGALLKRCIQRVLSLDALPCGTSMPPMVSIPAVAAGR